MSKQGLTPKQEKFAQGIAQGLSQADAYRAAFDSSNSTDKTIHEGASRLARNGKVAARVAVLTSQAAARAADAPGKAMRYELEDAMREIDEALATAKKNDNPTAMARCVELKAKLNGLMVEDRKNQRRPLEELTDAQLEARIERLNTAPPGAQVSVH